MTLQFLVVFSDRYTQHLIRSWYKSRDALDSCSVVHYTGNTNYQADAIYIINRH